MSDHDFDEDHNYYSRSNRQSQIPDYDVTQLPSSSSSPNLQTLPAFAYRQSHEFASPLRPTVDTNLDRNVTNGTSSRPGRPSQLESSPDPHEFYRQYRDSFMRHGGSVYGSLDNHPTENNNGMTTTRFAQRNGPSTNRSNGYAPSPVVSRWNNRFENRNASSSPLSDKVSASASKAGTPNVYVPRGRQTSLQALVNKFNSTPDETPPVPGSKPSSRSTSANNNPSTNAAQRSFRTRTSADSFSSMQSAAPPRRPAARQLQGLQVGGNRKRSDRALPATPVKSPKDARRASALAGNTLASQSLTDLSPALPAQKGRRPLFGEILHASANSSSDPGYGIPDTRRRRGSEGSMHHPSPMFEEESNNLMLKVSPGSPTAWYMGVTPTLDGIDLEKPVPSKPSGVHTRSRSDFGAGGGFTMAPLPNAAGKTITVLPPPPEQTTPTSPTTPKRTSQSRIPIPSARRTSVTSDSGNSTVSPGPYSARRLENPHPAGYRASSSKSSDVPSTSLPPRTPDNPSRSTTPRRSPRYRTASPPRQPSPRLPAYIAEQAPLKSPPLRSSRPRQPVSSASTAASRARAAANSTEQGSSQRDRSKKTAESATVNLAARRQMITRAFTKSMIEREEETRKRLSYFNELKNLDELRAKQTSNGSNTHVLSGEQPHRDLNDRSEGHDVFLTPGEELPSTEVGLSIDTEGAQRSGPVSIQEDSPTLGSSSLVTTQREQFEDSSPEPDSAVSSDTAETFFENEAQESPPDRGGSASRHGHVPESPGAASHDQYEYATPRRAMRSSGSEQDDGESIQIMLGDSPIMERLRCAEDFINLPESSTRSPQDQWHSQSQRPTLDRISEKTTPRTANDPHASFSTAGSLRDDQPWSPESVSSLISGHTTLDSESYNTINRVLDAYHDSTTPISPENMNEIQSRLFSQSPGLARAGGWDPSKVTQLYLQKYRKSPDLSAVPKPLNIRSSGGGPPSSAAGPSERSVRDSGDHDDPTERQLEDNNVVCNSPAVSLSVPSATMSLNRASLNNAEDWLNTSPSMLDWITRQALETPADEKDNTLRARNTSGSDNLTHPRNRSLLPDIPQGGLGILDLSEDTPQTPYLEQTAEPQPSVSEIYTSPNRKVEKAIPPSPPRKTVQPRTSSIGQTRTVDSFGRIQNGEIHAGSPVIHKRVAEAESSTIELTESKRPSISSEAPTKASSLSAEQLKKITRRKHIIKEMVDTESSFGQDMTVVVDIYKGTSNMVLSSPEDAKALFGNAHDIVSFSTTFLDSLKMSAKSVYVLQKSKRWRSKRDSSATTESTMSDDQTSFGGPEMSDEDKDRMTTVGAAFLENIIEMERVYTDYLKNHESASQKLQQLQKLQKVQVWLNQCRTYAHDLTTAWDLDSLLVKPVQRILKYPLLLKELVEVTPENHPDFVKLDTAARELVGVSKRINDAKKRADLVEQVTGASKAKRKEEGRLGLPKAFGRRSEKLKQQVGVIDNFQDREYDRISERFGSHFFQLQVVMRDVEMYVEDVTKWVHQFNEAAIAIDQYIDVNLTTYPLLESKWRKFRLIMKEMLNTALPDHVAAVRKYAIEPMTTLLKLHDGPQRLMEKRKKRVADFAKFRAIKDRGEKPDRKTSEQSEQFLAVNDTLKDELPRLFLLTGKLVEACLNNFVQHQLQWTSVWKRKLMQAIQLTEVPVSFDVVQADFAADFRYIEAQVLSLGVCNGSMIADASNFTSFGSSRPSLGGTTLNEGGGSRRPSVTPEEYRPRAISNATSDNVRGRGLSAHGGISPMLPSPDFGRPTEGFGLTQPAANNLAQPSIGLRIRANSSASSRSPVTPDIPGGWRNQPSGLPIAGTHPNRPSTATGRSYDSSYRSEGARYSSEAQNRLRPDSESTRYIAGRDGPFPSPSRRYSGIFSSAMPMSDSPRASSPSQGIVDEAKPPQDLTVLFLAASVYEFNIDKARREAGYPYLTYVAGEIFDVIGEKGELWLAKNQDDERNQVGWIWNKHFAKLAS